MKFDVFISYSSHDQKVVEGLCAYLEQHKIRCFVAYRDIPRGVVWARAIVEALDESRMMVVVFSDHFNNSDQVDREIELASEDRKPILTFRITDDAFKGAKKYYLKNINWIDAFPNPAELFGSVADNVAKLLDMELSAPTAKATPAPVLNSTPKPAPQPEPQPAPQPASAPFKSYKVGDYYNEGGKEGVVFEVSADGRHGKIVGLDEAELQWCTKEQYNKEIVVGASSTTDGKASTDRVMARSDSDEYPAFVWCRAMGKDWYLPARDELKSIYTAKEKINVTLERLGKIIIDDYSYWSSTEEDDTCAWYVIMYDGDAVSSVKSIDYYVRAVSAF